MKPDTIVALASGSGRAGVAVIRVSGPAAGAALGALTGAEMPTPRVATLSAFRDLIPTARDVVPLSELQTPSFRDAARAAGPESRAAAAKSWIPGSRSARPGMTEHETQEPESRVVVSGDLLDEGLALWFPAPASFTGEDVAELHVHGGPAVIEAIVAACLRVEGVRLAEAGEFTRRAFENGKLDLAQAEGLADLVDAETEGQRRQALRQSRGALSAIYERWRARLIEAAALIEAEIDFPDEDLPGALAQRAGPILEALAADMGRHLDDAHRGERVRDGYRIAIIGPPNAGKSSLLNALARREAAIVSELPGTTRDVVEVRLVLGGFPVWIADTAGLREAADAVEAEGVRRALARAEEADLRIGVVEAGQAPPADLLAALRPGDLLIRSKSDLRSPGERAARDPGPIGPASAEGPEFARSMDPGPLASPSSGERRVSALSGEGLEELQRELAARVTAALGREEAPALTRARHRRLVGEARSALERAQAALSAGPELAAEDVRMAATAIGRLTGRIDVEDLLDEIFASFCIGK